MKAAAPLRTPLRLGQYMMVRDTPSDPTSALLDACPVYHTGDYASTPAPRTTPEGSPPPPAPVPPPPAAPHMPPLSADKTGRHPVQLVRHRVPGCAQPFAHARRRRRRPLPITGRAIHTLLRLQALPHNRSLCRCTITLRTTMGSGFHVRGRLFWWYVAVCHVHGPSRRADGPGKEYDERTDLDGQHLRTKRHHGRWHRNVHVCSR